MATRPVWTHQYATGDPIGLEPTHQTAQSMWLAARARHPEGVFLRYFGSEITFAQVDAWSDRLAAGWVSAGVEAGSRIALFLQNVPAFAISLVAAWKIGSVAVPVNPMSKAKELDYVLRDSKPSVLITHPELWRATGAPVIDRAGERRPLILITHRDDFASTALPEVFQASPDGDSRAEPVATEEVFRFSDFIERHVSTVTPAIATVLRDDPAVLTYTSGTTGTPKGAINTHGNIAFNTESSWRWIGLDASDSILAVAPLFHVTGLVLHLGLSAFGTIPVVLTYRFDAPTMLDTLRQTRATFAVGSITAFIALLTEAMSDPAGTDKLSSLTKVLSGGAPVPSSVVDEFQQETGLYIRNVYGLTETTSPVTSVPRGLRAPVDPRSGALSVGVPMYEYNVRIVGDDGYALPPGKVGEIAVTGPGVVPGYWMKPEETRNALRDGELRTGDVGFMDDEGWLYVVDRKKDMIIASGYKVWPREVEDVLYGHPGVLEAAVVGLPDDYRGERVGAFVVARPGFTPTAEEIVTFCRQQIAAYKVPRRVQFVTELPKTATGKVLRRSLRSGSGIAPG